VNPPPKGSLQEAAAEFKAADVAQTSATKSLHAAKDSFNKAVQKQKAERALANEIATQTKIRDAAQKKLNDLEPRAKMVDAAKTGKDISDAQVRQSSAQAAFNTAKAARAAAEANYRKAQAAEKAFQEAKRKEEKQKKVEAAKRIPEL
jgi:hypothetical protein